MAMTSRFFVILAAAGFVCAVPAAAQRRAKTLPTAAPKAPSTAEVAQRTAFGVIDGMVTDSGFVPMLGAEIGILRTSIRISTNTQGRFRITDVQMGTYILMLRRFGYSPIASVIC
jgi:hypothetical protein